MEADRLLDNEAELYIWDVCESAVTIMAACIPTLRVLFRGMQKLPSTSNNNEFSDMSFSFQLSKIS